MRRQSTVIVPVRNRPDLVREAIGSLLAQSRLPDEIIVVDDGSTDGTAKALEAYGDRIILVRTPGLGPSAARNAGIRAARGDLIGFLDSDDLWPPDSLETQIRVLTENPDADVAWGTSRWIIMPGGAPLFRRPSPDLERNLSLDTMLFRRSVFERIGTFNEGLRLGEDGDLFLRARDAGISFVEHGALVAELRRHAGNMTNEGEAVRRSLLLAAREALRRKPPSGVPDE